MILGLAATLSSRLCSQQLIAQPRCDQLVVTAVHPSLPRYSCYNSIPDNVKPSLSSSTYMCQGRGRPRASIGEICRKSFPDTVIQTPDTSRSQSLLHRLHSICAMDTDWWSTVPRSTTLKSGPECTNEYVGVSAALQHTQYRIGSESSTCRPHLHS